MKATVKKSVEKVRDALHQAVAKLSPADYREVLEEIAGDIEGRLDALREEQGDED